MLDGIYTVFVTPFNEDDSIDYESINEWIKFQVENNQKNIVLMGTTSETPTLSREEQLDIIKYIYDLNTKNKYCLNLVIGIGGNNTKETLDFAVQCSEYSKIFMLTVPHYNKPTQEGIFLHYKTICGDERMKNKSFLMYNVPGRTSVNMETSTIVKITDACKNIVGIKEASGNIDQIIELFDVVKSRNLKLKIFCGDDKLIHLFCMYGGSGVISVASNVIPTIMQNIYDFCDPNNPYNHSRPKNISDFCKNSYSNGYFKFCKVLFCESNPIPVKYLLHYMKIFKTYHMRLPLTSLSEDKRNIVEDTFDDVNRKFLD